MFPGTVGMALFNAIGPWVWPYAEPYLKTFEPSPNRDATIDGAHARAVCQNSHVDWGEKIRRNQSLDGVWQVGEGSLGDAPPKTFGHQVPVPGLLTEATPPFEEVGLESDQREAFWYRTVFPAPAEPAARAHLCVHKAKYGVKVWLNGVELGEHYGPFTVSEYDLTEAIQPGENELLIRVGADRSRIPEFIPAGSDLEKYRWYPGLWDSVTVVYTGPYSIVRTKAEPELGRGAVRLRTTLRNDGDQSVSLDVVQTVETWPEGEESAEVARGRIDLAPGETREISQDVALHEVHPWSPEDPALYLARTTVLRDGVPSDDRATRFGMREMEWRAGDDKGFYLNGRRYYLRGTNIAFHRFLEDQDRRRLPWDGVWVRRLLSEHPKELGWNSFRFHVGRAPNQWYDIADEVGLIVADEYHVFAPIALGSEVQTWSLAEMEKEYAGWVRENWNHPSIGWWDASNETNSPLPYELVPRLRELDQTRAWESGSYGPPDRPDDPLEEHPYLLNGASFMNADTRNYDLDDLDDHPGLPPVKAGEGLFSSWNGPDNASHPYINNEYGWLWHTRDGERATPITVGAFERLAPGLELSPEERHEMYAYLVSELTLFWRSRRGYAGVQHFLYLGKCTNPDTVRADWEPKEASSTCDNFVDIENLVLEPRWRASARDAFAPVAVYLERWSNDFYRRGQTVSIPVALINDEDEERPATVRLVARNADGRVLAESEIKSLALPPLGRLEEVIRFDVPADESFVLYAELSVDGRPVASSRRKLGLSHPGALVRP